MVPRAPDAVRLHDLLHPFGGAWLPVGEGPLGHPHMDEEPVAAADTDAREPAVFRPHLTGAGDADGHERTLALLPDLRDAGK